MNNDYDNFRYGKMSERSQDRFFIFLGVVIIVVFTLFYFFYSNYKSNIIKDDVADYISEIEKKSFDNSVCIKNIDNATFSSDKSHFYLEYTLKINKDDFNMDCYNELKNEINNNLFTSYGLNLKAKYLILHLNEDTYKFNITSDEVLLDNNNVKNLLNDVNDNDLYYNKMIKY